jgi:hypothetical protein
VLDHRFDHVEHLDGRDFVIDSFNPSGHLFVQAEHTKVIFGFELDDDEGVDLDGAVLSSPNALRSEKLRGAFLSGFRCCNRNARKYQRKRGGEGGKKATSMTDLPGHSSSRRTHLVGYGSIVLARRIATRCQSHADNYVGKTEIGGD